MARPNLEARGREFGRMVVGQWAGYRVLVTGGAHGIGAAVVRAAVAEGAAAWILDLDESRGSQMTAELGASARFIGVNLSDEEELAKAVDEALNDAGAIDVLVNSASRDSTANVTTLSTAQWDQVIDLDLKTPWQLAQRVLPGMIAQRSGSIINIGSLHAIMSAPDAFPYGVAKAGLAALTRAICLDYGRYGIRANTVTPGWTLSERVEANFAQLNDDERQRLIGTQPMRRLGEPDEVASVVVFLGSTSASYVNGANWIVDGGLSTRFA